MSSATARGGICAGTRHCRRTAEDEDLVYLAPEQIQGKQADIRSDLYSLGAILYALSTGHLPSPVADMLATSQTPSQLNAKIPTSLEHLILELLDSDAESRPHNAELVVARLQQIGQNDLVLEIARNAYYLRDAIRIAKKHGKDHREAYTIWTEKLKNKVDKRSNTA